MNLTFSVASMLISLAAARRTVASSFFFLLWFLQGLLAAVAHDWKNAWRLNAETVWKCFRLELLTIAAQDFKLEGIQLHCDVVWSLKKKKKTSPCIICTRTKHQSPLTSRWQTCQNASGSTGLITSQSWPTLKFPPNYPERSNFSLSC